VGGVNLFSRLSGGDEPKREGHEAERAKKGVARRLHSEIRYPFPTRGTNPALSPFRQKVSQDFVRMKPEQPSHPKSVDPEPTPTPGTAPIKTPNPTDPDPSPQADEIPRVGSQDAPGG
jgi:hypothetical protein